MRWGRPAPYGTVGWHCTFHAKERLADTQRARLKTKPKQTLGAGRAGSSLLTVIGAWPSFVTCTLRVPLELAWLPRELSVPVPLRRKLLQDELTYLPRKPKPLTRRSVADERGRCASHPVVTVAGHSVHRWGHSRGPGGASRPLVKHDLAVTRKRPRLVPSARSRGNVLLHTRSLLPVERHA